MTEETGSVTGNAGAEQPMCRAVKHGVVDLQCELAQDHVDAYKPGSEGEDGWHMAVFTRHEEVAYNGARHTIDITETAFWEPLDHAAEAARHLMAAIRERAS